MRLVLMRHARAEDPVPGMADYERPLSARGHAQAASTAPRIAALGWAPDLVICSDALRTRETLAIVRRSLTSGIIRFDPRVYSEGPVQPVAEVADGVETLLVVGHNPFLEGLASALSLQNVALGTAEAALLELDPGRTWRDALAHRWRLTELIRP